MDPNNPLGTIDATKNWKKAVREESIQGGILKSKDDPTRPDNIASMAAAAAAAAAEAEKKRLAAERKRLAAEQKRLEAAEKKRLAAE